MNPTDWIGLGLAAVGTMGAGVWAVASLIVGQINKNIDGVNSSIIGRLDAMEQARRSASEQWRAMFADQRRQSREVAVRIDHVEERIQQFEHVVSSCHHHLPNDLPD